MSNIIGMWHILDRAIEVAKTGGHTLSVFFREEYTNGFDDYQTIKKFYRDWFDGFAEKGDMSVEVCKPEYGTPSETLGAIAARVKRAAGNKDVDAALDGTCKTILRTAIRMEIMSVAQVHTAQNVAKTIAKMSGSPRIKAEHIAEAIQYCSGYNIKARPRMYNAESGAIMFGGSITVKPGRPEKGHIVAAIQYLQDML